MPSKTKQEKTKRKTQEDKRQGLLEDKLKCWGKKKETKDYKRQIRDKKSYFPDNSNYTVIRSQLQR